MKLIDRTPYLNEKGELAPWHKVLGMLRFGDFWVDEIKAQKGIIEDLERTLAPGYTLLRNIQLPGTKILFPMILVGPAGIWMMTITTMKGNFQAIEGSWEIESKGKTKPSRPNLMRDTQKMAQAVQNYLERFGVKKGVVEGVLIAANLGMYINKVNPIVRIVMRDTVSLFADDINKSEGMLDTSSINRIVDVLAENLPEPQQVSEIALPKGFGDMPQPDEFQERLSEMDQSEPEESEPLRFGGDSTPWNLMEEFNFDASEDTEQVENDIPEVSLGASEWKNTVNSTPKNPSLPTQKKPAKRKFTTVQLIVLAGAAVVVIYLLAFIVRTLGNIL